MQTATRAGEHRRVRNVATELLVVTAVFMAYRSGRLLTRESTGEALRNARHVIDFEKALGIFSERAVQGWVLGSHTAVEVLNRYYVSVHFPITVAFLLWAYFRHNAAYRVIRTWFVLVTLTALAIHVGFPLAPPRMTPGFVDTLQKYGPHIYPRDTSRSVANQFAAMPSLHFGWSIMLATGVIAIKRNRRSAIILLHPAITLTAIVATGNHYWLDAMVAGLLAAVFGTVLMSWRLLRTGSLIPNRETPMDDAQTIVPAPMVDLDLDDVLDDDDRLSSLRRRERCRQHIPGGHERLDLDEMSSSPASRAEPPPPV
jgi:hypothetical protein